MSVFIPRPRIERLAAEALREYARRSGIRLAPPVDVDRIGEVLFDLAWEYDMLADPSTLAALFPRGRLVRLNELHVARFTAKPGLERFTKGHEIGHWVLHADPGMRGHPDLGLGVAQEEVNDRVEPVFCRDGSKDATETQADMYAASLLMPIDLLLPVLRDSPPVEWRAVYGAADVFGVTVSAMRVRLEGLGLMYVDDGGDIYRSREECSGQRSLF